MSGAFSSALKKLCLQPGVLFPIANLFAFIQSGNRLAIGIALANILFSVLATLHNDLRLSPLRVTAWMALSAGLCSFWSGSPLPGFAGLAFSTGNFLSSNANHMASLHNPSISPAMKAIGHPAVFYGLGYSMTGLMAGGGMALLKHPYDHLPALLMVGMGVTTIMVSSLGLALNLLKAAIPFWILACGTGINALAGVAVGNYVGAGSPFFAMLGELRLGWITHDAETENHIGSHHGL